MVSPGPGLQKAEGGVERPPSVQPRWEFAAGERFALPLPGRGRVELTIDSVWNPVEGVNVYTGRMGGRLEWLFTLAVDSDETLGRFFIENRVYILENFANRAQLVLHELDRSRLPKVPDSLVIEREGSQFPREGEFSTQSTTPPSCSGFTSDGANGHARVLFLHSPDVATGISSLVASIVAEFNSSADNSRVELDNFITVADIRQVNDNFDGLCKRPILDRMENESGVFQGLSQLMDSTDADIAFLIVSEDPNATNSLGQLCLPNLGRIGGIAWALNPDIA